MFADMQKMFDPAQASQMMQTWQNMWNAGAVEQQAETTKKLASIWGETFASLYQQQATMAQQAMQTSVECMKDMSSAKGMEDMMAKQASWSKKCTETCQSSAQTMASTLQKGYQQATETITKAASCCNAGASSKPTAKSN
ncbi:MAG: phasin family protein [Alphaproteobacteria bacterium]